jgi:hypothetical protein
MLGRTFRIGTHLALPHADHGPSGRLGGSSVPPVPSLVGSDLLSPSLRVRTAMHRGAVGGAPVPETTVDEDGDSVTGQYEVRSTAWGDLSVESLAQSQLVHGVSQRDLRLSVP